MIITSRKEKNNIVPCHTKYFSGEIKILFFLYHPCHFFFLFLVSHKKKKIQKEHGHSKKQRKEGNSIIAEVFVFLNVHTQT